MDTLAARIRYARTLAGLTQAQVGHAFDITREAVSAWESGANAPTADKIGILANLTGVPAEWLFRGGPLDPKTLRPSAAVLDDLTAFVATLQGKQRERALAMLKILADEWAQK